MKYDSAKLDELKMLIYQRLIALATGDRQADHLRVFVKPEPHKKSKLEEGRLRLISAVSLLDTCVDRVLFTWLMQVALDNFLHTPSMVGWTPNRGSWRQLWVMFGGRSLSLDKSAWDWTVQGWLIDAIKSLIQELAVDAPLWWVECMDARFDLLFRRAVFEFQDGTVVHQMGKGIMKSGCYLTILANTLGQILTHVVACQETGDDPRLTMPRALGDDTVQDGTKLKDVSSYCAALEHLGCKVKGGQTTVEVDFVGFEITEHACVPAYRNKHFFKQEYTSDLPGFLMAMQMLYFHAPAFYSYYRSVASVEAPEAVTSRPEAARLLG